MKQLSKSELQARSLISGDLFRKGEITRVECFRVELDAAFGENTGDLKFENNTDYDEGLM